MSYFIADCQATAEKIATAMIGRSAFFSMTPLPDDFFKFEFKPENEKFVRQCAAVIPTEGKVVCDGCIERGINGEVRIAVRYEHRCHRNNIVIRGEKTDFSCECPSCAELFK